MPLHVSSTCAHHQEVKNALHSLWYHQPIGGLLVQETATYRCDDITGCVMHFWPPDDEHMCSKHAEAWNKLILKQKFCSSSWLITEINILRYTVSKTSKETNLFLEVYIQRFMADRTEIPQKAQNENTFNWSLSNIRDIDDVYNNELKSNDCSMDTYGYFEVIAKGGIWTMKKKIQLF